jgi:hypothetical protein
MIDEATRLIVPNLTAITASVLLLFQGSVRTTMPQRLGSQHAAILRDGFQLMVRLPSIDTLASGTHVIDRGGDRFSSEEARAEVEAIGQAKQGHQQACSAKQGNLSQIVGFTSQPKGT